MAKIAQQRIDMPEFVKQIAQDVSGRLVKVRKKAANITATYLIISSTFR